MANRYAAQSRETSGAKTWLDALVACAPMSSLVAGLGLAGAGYATQQSALAAGGAVVCAAGLYVERLQARSLRRRRRAERMRSRHEITELRRTIAQLREDVDAFQRALLDTEAALVARSLPLLPPLPAAPGPAVATPDAASSAPAPATRVPAASAGDDVVVVPLADVEASAWVQTRESTPPATLPAAPPFIAPSVIAPAAAPAAAPEDLVYAAIAEADATEATRALAYPEGSPGHDAAGGGRDDDGRTANDAESLAAIQPGRHVA